MGKDKESTVKLQYILEVAAIEFIKKMVETRTIQTQVLRGSFVLYFKIASFAEKYIEKVLGLS